MMKLIFDASHKTGVNRMVEGDMTRSTFLVVASATDGIVTNLPDRQQQRIYIILPLSGKALLQSFEPSKS